MEKGEVVYWQPRDERGRFSHGEARDPAERRARVESAAREAHRRVVDTFGRDMNRVIYETVSEFGLSGNDASEAFQMVDRRLRKERELEALRRATGALLSKVEFEEDEHPRDTAGRFAPKGAESPTMTAEEEARMRSPRTDDDITERTFSLLPPEARTEEGARDLFVRRLLEMSGRGDLNFFHESPGDAKASMLREGIRGESIFAAIGKPSEFVRKGPKTVVEFRIPPQHLKGVDPDMAYTWSAKMSPEQMLLLQHPDPEMRGAYVAFYQNVPKGWIRGIRVVGAGDGAPEKSLGGVLFGKRHVVGAFPITQEDALAKAGTSEGARLGWETRRAGGAVGSHARKDFDRLIDASRHAEAVSYRIGRSLSAGGVPSSGDMDEYAGAVNQALDAAVRMIPEDEEGERDLKVDAVDMSLARRGAEGLRAMVREGASAKRVMEGMMEVDGRVRRYCGGVADWARKRHDLEKDGASGAVDDARGFGRGQ